MSDDDNSLIAERRAKLAALREKARADGTAAFPNDYRRDVLASSGDASYNPEGPLPTTVVIRADKDTPFNLVNRILKECRKNGYQSFSLRAMTKEEGGA